MRGIMSTYTQLTQEEQYQIYALIKAGYSQTEIASMLGRDKSTIRRDDDDHAGKIASPFITGTKHNSASSYRRRLE
jgi:IS30 family transposase